MFAMIPNRTRQNLTTRGLFDSFADDLFRPFFANAACAAPGMTQPMRVDVTDDGDHYTLQADVPGVSKDDLKVEITDGVLTISAEYDQKNEQKDENDKFIYRERRCGSMRRSFNVEGIREEDITAAFNDGVLKLTLPKQQEAVPQTHAIQIQ